MKKIKRYVSLILTVMVLFTVAACFTANADTYIILDDFKFKRTADNEIIIAEYLGTDTTLVVPDTIIDLPVTGFESAAFENNQQIKKIVFGKNFKTLSAFCFSNSVLEEVVLPSTLTSISWFCFKECKQLKSVVIEDSAVTALPRNLFYGCDALTSVDLGNNITSIGAYAFAGCTSLKELYIPNSVTEIDPTAFNKDTELTIACYSDSYAHTFAREKGIAFRLIDGYQLGDVDRDGKVTIGDVSEIQMYLAHLSTFDDEQMRLADYDGDGIVTIIDVTYIQLAIAGL